MSETQICVSLDGTTLQSITDEAVRANLAGADFIEVRFDKMYLVQPDLSNFDEEEGETPSLPPIEEWERKKVDDIEPKELIDSILIGMPLPVIFTVRSQNEQGFFPGSEEERIEILSMAIDAKVAWVDLELNIPEKQRKELADKANKNGVKVIASEHNHDGMPSDQDIIQLVEENQSKGDIVKFCGQCTNHHDALQVVNAAWDLKNKELNYSIMGLSSGGDWARLHAPLFNQNMVFATMQNEFRLSDKGLINVRDLREAWTLLEY